MKNLRYEKMFLQCLKHLQCDDDDDDDDDDNDDNDDSDDNDDDDKSWKIHILETFLHHSLHVSFCLQCRFYVLIA